MEPVVYMRREMIRIYRDFNADTGGKNLIPAGG
jgi:hypothetical protein